MVGRECSNMQKLIAILAAALTLAFLEFGFSGGQAQAGSGFCKYRYNLCLARCARVNRGRCFRRCREQFRRCTPPAPHLGDLI
jgi:hypothetical protein